MSVLSNIIMNERLEKEPKSSRKKRDDSVVETPRSHIVRSRKRFVEASAKAKIRDPFLVMPRGRYPNFRKTGFVLAHSPMEGRPEGGVIYVRMDKEGKSVLTVAGLVLLTSALNRLSKKKKRMSDAILPVVVTGPSGAGKGTLISALKKAAPDRVGFCISHTTRDPRPGEKDGVHYHFVKKEEMLKMIENGEFLEYANVHTNIYGTSIAAMNAIKKQNKICILDIDVQGARSIRKLKHIKARFLFVAPPSMDILEKRLRGRGTETEDKIRIRLQNAKIEMASREEAGLWDHVMVNGKLEESSKAFVDFVLDGKM